MAGIAMPTVTAVTDTTATFLIEDSNSHNPLSGYSIAIYAGSTPVTSTPVSGADGVVTTSGLTPNTTYNASISGGGSSMFTTKQTGYNSPRSATQEQWEDLTGKVKSKAEIGTVLSTPTSTEFVSTDNLINSAVTSSKIADGAVTNTKINWSTTEFNIPLSNLMSLQSGYTIDSYFFAYQTGNLITLQFSVKKDSGNFSGGDTIGFIVPSYRPKYDVNYMCALVIGGYWSTNAAGYLYISATNGALTIGDATNGCNYAKVQITYPINY